jgi:hypothetical protein
MQNFEAHGSVLAGNPRRECWLVEIQEVEVTKDGRGIILFHEAAAGARGFAPFTWALISTTTVQPHPGLVQCQRSPDFIVMAHFLPSQVTTGMKGGGCEGDVWLLKFCVCWDAAVCAISVGGFFNVWDGVRKTNDWNGLRKANIRMAFVRRTTGAPSYRPDPPRDFSSVTPVRQSTADRFWPLWKGDYAWQSTMLR